MVSSIWSILRKAASRGPSALVDIHVQEALLWQRDRAMRFSVEILQLQNIPIVWHYLGDPAFSRFHTIPECDRHTHRQTDGQIHDDGMYCA